MTVRVALVHDWLTGMRGGEKVLDVLCEHFPEAELFTLLHVRGSVSAAIERHRIRTSCLQWLPGIARYYRACLPLFPALVEQFDLDDFDVVISSSHAAAKAVVARPGALHICYCHTPMRYGWDQFDAYFGPARVGRVGSRLLRTIMARLARWDRDTSGRVTRYLTNSQFVARRIRRYYGRDAVVVYPPADTEFFRPAAVPRERFLLVVSALVPYKLTSVALEASRLAGVHLKVVGDGPERTALERVAASSKGDVQFLGHVPETILRDLYRRAAALVLPGEEDCGIVPLEAQACGCPVLALGRGGVLETVIPGETGLFVWEPTPAAFADGIRNTLDRAFDAAAIRRHAERFSRARFSAELKGRIDELWPSDAHPAPSGASARTSR